MKYSDWEQTVPESIKQDTLWNLAIYRCTLFLSDLCWLDASKLVTDPRTLEVAGDLYDAVGSIGTGLSLGYSRGAGRERSRYFEESLGYARESRHWYYKSRHILGPDVVEHRLNLLGIIIRLTGNMAAEPRSGLLQEEALSYGSEGEGDPLREFSANLPLDLLEKVPMAG